MEELSMAELLELREKMGAKDFEQQVTVPKIRELKRKLKKSQNENEIESEDETKKPTKKLEKKPLVKNAPEEASSKKRPPKSGIRHINML